MALSDILQKVGRDEPLTDEEREELRQETRALDEVISVVKKIIQQGSSALLLSGVRITNGKITASDFIALAPSVVTENPTEAGFTGTFVSGKGETFGSTVYNIGGVAAGVLQWGASQTTGKLIMAAGNIFGDTDGFFLKNVSGVIYFGNAADDGTWPMSLYGNASDFLQLQNETAGKGIAMIVTLTDASTPALFLEEDPDVANTTRFLINENSAAPVHLVFGGNAASGNGIDIWVNKDGKETVFNDTSYDIDHRWEGASDPNLTVMDAGLDAVAHGGAAESGFKLKVHGNLKVTGSITPGGGTFALPADITPATFGTTQNNYNPTGLSTADVLRLETTASSSITGLAGGADGRIIVIYNIGSTYNIFLVGEDTASSAANRFIIDVSATAADDILTIAPKQAVVLIYDSTSQRWRPLNSSATHLQGAPISYSIKTTLANNDLLRWNSTDAQFQPLNFNDANITTTDTTTNNASTSKHGWLKKLSNVATEFMNGVGNWVNPTSSMLLIAHALGDTAAASTTEYIAPNTNVLSTTQNTTLLTLAGTLKNFYVRTGSAQPASGSLVATVQIDGVDTSITLTIAAGAAAGNFSDTTHTAAVVAANRIGVKFVNNATAASATVGSVVVQYDVATT